jgi:S-DNA-T family DNA segregation ATPase FtsK/SpoIIIE
MARTGTRTRQGAVRAAGARRSRGRNAWRIPILPGNGSPANLGAILFRAETAALLIGLAGLLAIPTFVALDPIERLRSSVSDVAGVHAFSFALLLLVLAGLVVRRRLDLAIAYPRYLALSVIALVVTFGVLGFFSPNLSLDRTDLSEVTAGGRIGDYLSSGMPGLAIWLVAFVAFIAGGWPHRVKAAIQGMPGVAATVWGWRLHAKFARGVVAFIDFIFPTKAPPDERPADAAPAWLPSDTMAETATEVLTEAEVIPQAPIREVQLPMAWDAASPPEESVERTWDGPKWSMPPLTTLVSAPPVEETGARPDNAHRANLLVETLASFGVDARVVQVNEGPVVTQFGIEPGWEVKYRQVPERDRDGRPILDKDGKPKTRQEEVSRTRVRVNQITALQNDLALALAAPAIRLEAPVPGKSVIGIEVPNTSASVVTLRSVIETPAFQRLAPKAKLGLALGKSVSGEPVVADLARMPHLLIAGATGSGKSVCLNSIIACLLMHASPEEVRFVMVDPKRVELSSFGMIPHLVFSNIIVDVEKVVGTLGAVIAEMDARYKRFAALAVRNIDAYNRHPKVTERLPYWVVIIDELADLMMAAPFEVERQICRLAQLARATGIHLIVATQRPSVDVITGLIKANFPTRIAFATSSQVDSRTILDTAGAERLLGRGDMLYMPTDASKPRRLQGVYVSDQEIDRIVAHWVEQRSKPGHSTLVYDHLLEQAQAAIQEEAEGDPLLDRARALAMEHTRVSTSMLQRRLRVGYPRAARIMDMLEEEGLVGGGGDTHHDSDFDDD